MTSLVEKDQADLDLVGYKLLQSKFAKLLSTQMLVRATIQRNSLSQLSRDRINSQIEIVSFHPDLYKSGSTKKAHGYLHLEWMCTYDGTKGGLSSSEFRFITLKASDGPAYEDNLVDATRDLLEYWKKYTTRDRLGIYPQWLEPNPFVGVASVGFYPDTRVRNFGAGSGVIKKYYGYLLARLEAYVEAIRYAGNFVDGEDLKYLLLKEALYRFRVFVSAERDADFYLLFGD